MAGSQVVLVDAVMIEKQRIGFCAVSLTHFSDGVAPEIAAGSKHESGGALFEYTVDEAVGSLAGIANSSQVYIKTVVAGAAITAVGTTTAPAWSTSKQGWYIGADRVIGGCYKDSGGNYVSKWLYDSLQQGFGDAPIGAIIAWHKSLAGCPPLPSTWVECNGQVLSDGGSPFNGQTIPDLNGGARFLRGGAASGTMQAQGTKLPTVPFTLGASALGGGAIDGFTPGNTLGARNPVWGGGDAETRPVNMSVVWIMRIK